MTRAIIQARMGSARLRGKSLMMVAGYPLLQWVIHSAKQLPFVNEVMVATTTLDEDNVIAEKCALWNVNCFRGDALNVLARFDHAVHDLKEKDQIIRLTADNPVLWAEVNQKLYDHHIRQGNDYTGISGMSPLVGEIFTVRSLREAQRAQNLSDFDQEHVTPYMRRQSSSFRSEQLPADFGGLRHDLDRYLTIDTFEDQKRLENLFTDLHYSMDDAVYIDISKVYAWLRDHELGFQKSLAPDAKIVNLAGTPVGEGFPTYVIAEIGQNHNGDMGLAKKLIDMAARCRANAVKFQKRDIPSELSREAYEKPYDNPNSFGRTYGEHREFLEMGEDQHLELKEYATARGITYFCTPCDIPSLDMMERIGSPFHKVASRDLTNIPLLEAMGKTRKPIIISTGMANFQDIEDALKALNRGPESLIIMQCTSQYPCRLENVNLEAMNTLKNKYGFIVGLSDHSSGVIVSAAATVMGAAIIEKHITLDRTMKGTDQPGSLEESGLYKLIDYIRAVEKARGDGIKDHNPEVTTARNKLARSLTSAKNIPKGTVVSEDMLCLKSPGTGILWRDKNKIVGKTAVVDICKDVTIDLGMVT